MQKEIDAVGLLSTAAMRAQKAKNFPPETYIIDLADLRRLSGKCNGMSGKRRAHDLRDCPREPGASSGGWALVT